ncbi:MAG: tetratricopeptide repeat protein [Pseudolabrys sp.]
MTMQAPAAKPKRFNVQHALQQALTFHHQGRLPEAERIYVQILEFQPTHFDALQMLGVIKLARGQMSEALRLVGAALQRKPHSAQALINHGMVLNALDRHDEALANFDEALKHKANFAEGLNNRGATLATLGRDKEALDDFRRALKIKPDYPEALSNMANSLRLLGEYEEALAIVERALALRPNYAKGHNNRGTLLDTLKRSNEALECYERALAVDPNYADALSNRGRALRAIGRYEDALQSLNKAIEIKPNFAQAYFNRGAVLSDLNRYKEATANLEQAMLGNARMFVEPKFAVCIAELPILYRDEAEIGVQRAAYEKRLLMLRDEINAVPSPGVLLKGVGPFQPFYLAYQGQNDRELQSIYGSALCRVSDDIYPPVDLVAPPAPGEPVRVGIVSGFFRLHSNWKIPIKGWLSQLDRKRFRLFGYHTGHSRDDETKFAASACERFVQGPLPVEKWRKEILADAPHVLIYPEVGMDEMCVKLAVQRLAPVQCNSWGHPDTSGFPTLDYYISSDMMEPPDGQAHYSERLLRLPNLSIYYEPPPIVPVQINRAELGLRDGTTAFWCGQSIFKYLPQYDDVFPRIAREADDCQFAFIQYQGARAVTDLFRERLERAFAAHGLRWTDYCVVLPRLDPNRFAAAIGQCDVVLDSIGWSGCNSTLEGLTHDLPVVTMPGTLMRGRHSAAILQMMGVAETIAPTTDDYVATAVRLAREPEWRAALKQKIGANKHRVYHDRACITALEDFLDRVGRGQ